MGEYVKIGNDTVKIGTCEDLYYTSFQNFQKLAENRIIKEKKETIKEYLTGGFRFRFPFPDEPAIILFSEVKNFDRGVLFIVPKKLGVEILHDKKFVRTDNFGTETAAPAVGFYIPCVQSEEFTIKKYDWSDTANYTIFEIEQQKPVKNENGNFELFTIVRCPYCSEKSRISKEEILSIQKYVHENKSNFSELQKQIIDIAVDGYREFEIMDDYSINYI